MPELTPADVQTFTRGRLSATDPVVQDILDAALVRARNYVEWHVSPVLENVAITLDGPGGRQLFLPTKRIVSLTSIVENGTAVSPSGYVISADIANMVYRKNGCWTREYAGIVVTCTHGFDEDEAADWRRAIMLMVDRMSREQQTGARSDDDLVIKKVDDVQYQWADWSASASRALTSVEAILDKYCLVPSGFA